MVIMMLHGYNVVKKKKKKNYARMDNRKINKKNTQKTGPQVTGLQILPKLSCHLAFPNIIL